MAETAMEDRSPWGALVRPGRFGAAGPEAGVVIGEAPTLATALLTIRKGQGAALNKAAKVWGVELPSTPRWVSEHDISFIWAGPGQWLVRGPGSFADLSSSLAALAPFGTFIDQSHARAALVVRGSRARDTLAKGLDIDLHPRAFSPGDVALTQAAGMSAHLWQLDEAPTYTVAVPASFAGSFWHWLADAAAEYGYKVEPGLRSTESPGQ